MSALSNVITRGDGTVSPCVGFVPNSNPEGSLSHEGVSVRYAQEPTKKWYVLRATYGRAEQAYRYIVGDEKSTDAYMAMHYVRKKGSKKRVREPLLQGLVFVYCTEDDARAYVKDTPAICFVRFYYNRTVTYADGTNPPLEVDYNAMMNFIRVTSIDDDNIMRLDEEFVKYESNDLVEVIDGKFQGVKGRVARAAGQQRVIVELEGVALVATAYIPTAFLRRLSQA